MNLKKIKRAIISVSDKSNLKTILKVLKKYNVEIISTGGSFKKIKNLKYHAIEVANYTGFSEMLDGRVKTLHPKIYAGILNKRKNKKPIKVSKMKQLSNALLVTGFPYDHNDEWELSFDLFRDIYRNTQGIRRLGAAALDLCFVAMGRFEGFWELELKPWDICAGALIVEEAGGKVTDWNGSPVPFSGKRILATNSHIHNEMIQILRKKLS